MSQSHPESVRQENAAPAMGAAPLMENPARARDGSARIALALSFCALLVAGAALWLTLDPPAQGREHAALQQRIASLEKTLGARRPPEEKILALQSRLTPIPQVLANMESRLQRLEQPPPSQPPEAATAALDTTHLDAALQTHNRKWQDALQAMQQEWERGSAVRRNRELAVLQARAAFAEDVRAGRPFTDALAALPARDRAQWPEELSALAPTGLPRQSRLEENLHHLVPQYLRAAHTEDAADWQSRLLAEMQSLITVRAARPMDAQNTLPENLARLQSALDTADWARAQALLENLPPLPDDADTEFRISISQRKDAAEALHRLLAAPILPESEPEPAPATP